TSPRGSCGCKKAADRLLLSLGTAGREDKFANTPMSDDGVLPQQRLRQSFDRRPACRDQLLSADPEPAQEVWDLILTPVTGPIRKIAGLFAIALVTGSPPHRAPFADLAGKESDDHLCASLPRTR